jgi:hypothetical protein
LNEKRIKKRGLMRRRLFQWPGFGLAIGLALLPTARAGDRKSEITSHKAEVGRPAFAMVSAFSGHAFTAVTAAQATSTRKDEPKESGQAAHPQHKTITFFRLNPKLGDVSVQPVVGGVNGAQLSIGF